ncbi:MAG: hypothetical protein HY921_09290 [Elusimicrobia bacterium]|nr:hypothetical protein [Elusimicrobiota bacterium]
MANPEVEVPQFKLAKVGKERGKKKGGLPLWFGSAGKGAGALATGGAGSAAGGGGLAAFLATVGGKVAVALLVAALGAGAYGIGKQLAPNEGAFEAGRKPKLFASDKGKYEGDLSNLPKNTHSIPNSMGYVTGSLDGKTPEQRAAEAAAAEAAAKAAAEKEAQAQSGEPPPAPEATPGGVDPAALAAAGAAGAPGAAGENKGPLGGKKLGELSKSLGSGLGGGGMSGGIGQAFSAPKLSVKAPAPSKTGNFARATKAGRASARAANVGSARGKTLAARQLNRAFGQSVAARSGPLDNSSARATNAFENQPAANSGITGAGAGTGAGIQGPGSGTGGTGVNSPSGGQPTETGNAPQAEELAPAPAVGKKNVTPWQGLIKTAAAMLMLAGLLLLVAGILVEIAKRASTVPGAQVVAVATLKMAKTLAMIATGLAGIATLMGLMIMGQGQSKQGALLTGLGAITTAAAAWVAFGGMETANKFQLESEQFIQINNTAIYTAMGAGALGGLGGAASLFG